MRNKLPFTLSLIALVVAALGWTSIGGTAGSLRARGGSGSLGGAAQKVRQKADVRRRAHKAAKIVAERSSIRAVKYDAHRVRSRTGQ